MILSPTLLASSFHSFSLRSLAPNDIIIFRSAIAANHGTFISDSMASSMRTIEYLDMEAARCESIVVLVSSGQS